jgi:D-3-phosphoglycerate dehydrogenase
MSASIRILITDPLADEGLAVLRQESGWTVDTQPGLKEAQLIESIPNYHALIIRSGTKVTAPVLAAAAQLQVIGRAGIGVDNVDVAAATERGVVVLNTPDANATSAAELTIAHMLALSRHLPQADRSVRAGEWQRTRYMGDELSGKTIGIIGLGMIGRLVAQRAQGLRMQVCGYDPFVAPEVFKQIGVESRDLDSLLASADYLSLHCVLSDKTRNLIGAPQLARMKPGACLINCARGGLVDEQALYESLKSGHLAGAALDVFVAEPPKASPLLELDNVVLTPHLGASTHQAQLAASTEIARQVVGFLKTGEAMHAVNLPRVSSEALARIRPYLLLAEKLGRLLAQLCEGPVAQIAVALHGRAAELDLKPIATEALVGFLSTVLDTPANRVNARYLAQRQGISVVESCSSEAQEYLATVSLTGRNGDCTTTVIGTLMAERHPRLVRIDGYELEAALEGVWLITRHDDRPGVIGALGTVLGRRQVNIERMEVGGQPNHPDAIAVIGISGPLDAQTLSEITAIPAIHKVWQVQL